MWLLHRDPYLKDKCWTLLFQFSISYDSCYDSYNQDNFYNRLLADTGWFPVLKVRLQQEPEIIVFFFNFSLFVKNSL